MRILTDPDTKGIHVFSGTPGSGKTFCTKSVCYRWTCTGKKVMLIATTGAAATKFSESANTVHGAFAIHATGKNVMSITAKDSLYQRILAADLIVIDEMSMLTQHTFSLVLSRIRRHCRSPVPADQAHLTCRQSLPATCHLPSQLNCRR